MAIHHKTCPLCEAMCGLKIEVENGRVGRITGDRDDPLSRGALCPKAIGLGDLHHDPDRLKAPLLKQGDRHVAIGWDEAIDMAVERLSALRREGPTAVGIYMGNPTVHNGGAILGSQLLQTALKSRAKFSAATMDQRPHEVASWLFFGHHLAYAVPDVDRTDLMVIAGGNPLVSNGSIMTAPGFHKRMKGIQKRGKVIVIDPRRSETARAADEHLTVRPRTDAFWLAAVARELATGALRERLEPFTPERAEARTGIPAARIRQLAVELRDTERAVLYGRIGVCVSEFATLAAWLLLVINHLAGNLDVEGGLMFPKPAIDALSLANQLGRTSHRDVYRSRVRGAPEVMGELPVSALVEEITTPGPGRIKGLVTIAGNPALSTPDGPAVSEAFEQLDFMVSVDIYLNETSRHADLVLPPATGLEIDNYDVALHALAVRNTAKFSPAIFPTSRPDDFEILTRLAKGIARKTRRWQAWATTKAARGLGFRGMLDLFLRLGPYKLRLKDLPDSGLDLGPMTPWMDERLQGHRPDLTPPLMVDDLARLDAHPEDTDDILLIGRRDLRSNNSWMHNLPTLRKGNRDRCTLLVHPDDAARLGLVDGGVATVSSDVGELQAPVQVSDEVMPGVVSLPHGWGHHGGRQKLANTDPGVNCNIVIDRGPLDPVSGTSAFTGQPVTVSPA